MPTKIQDAASFNVANSVYLEKEKNNMVIVLLILELLVKNKVR